MTVPFGFNSWRVLRMASRKLLLAPQEKSWSRRGEMFG